MYIIDIFKFSFLTLKAVTLSVKKVADSAPKPESRVQLSA